MLVVVRPGTDAFTPASMLAPYDFTRLLFTRGANLPLLRRGPDIGTWIGAAVIFGASILVTRAEVKHAA